MQIYTGGETIKSFQNYKSNFRFSYLLMENINFHESIQNQSTSKEQLEGSKRIQNKKKELKNIIEITENSEIINPYLSQEHQKEDQPQAGLINRGLLCLKSLYKKLIRQEPTSNIQVEESQLSQIVYKLKKKKITYTTILPERTKCHKTLVLDLDETLIYTQFKKPSFYDFEVQIEDDGTAASAYVTKRFGLDFFLFEMSKKYEIVLFSSSKRKYIDCVLEHIDPKKRISHVLSIQHCISINKKFFLKPLKVLGRPLNTVIVVDVRQQAISCLLNPENLYKVDAFQGNPSDRKLLQVASFLGTMAEKESILPVITYRKKFENREIRIEEKPRHKKSGSQFGLLTSAHEIKEETNLEFRKDL